MALTDITHEDSQSSNENDINNFIIDEDTNDVFISPVANIELPKVDVAEKIILCIDVFLDKDVTTYATRNLSESYISRCHVIYKAIEMFLVNKISLQKDSQFALISIESNEVKWIIDFTNDVKKIVTVLRDLEYKSRADNVDHYDFTQVFQKIHQNIVLPERDSPEYLPPSEVYRSVILFNSSECVPKLDKTDAAYSNLMMSPYFILDIVYLNDGQSENNNCQRIFNDLAGICKSSSYIFDISKSITKLFNSFSYLLSHPLQRTHITEL